MERGTKREKEGRRKGKEEREGMREGEGRRAREGWRKEGKEGGRERDQKKEALKGLSAFQNFSKPVLVKTGVSIQAS